MHAENFLIYNGGYRKAVETIGENFPDLDAVSSLAFIIEPIDSVYSRAFMVSSQQEEVFWIFDFVSEQKTDRLKTLPSSVYIISKEHIIGFWWKSTIFEQTQQIVILPMNVSADFQGRFEFEQDRLGNKNLSAFATEPLDLLFGEVDSLARFEPSYLKQFIYNVIYVALSFVHLNYNILRVAFKLFNSLKIFGFNNFL